jgi:hypothetical protein
VLPPVVSSAPAARPAPTTPPVRPTATSRPPPPVAAPPPPRAAPPPAAAKKDEEDDTGGVFGPFRIGFLVGVGVPNLVSLGGQMKLTRFLGLGVNVGLIPTVKISFYGQAKLSYQEYDAYARIYPFGGGFFLGTGVGYETMKGSISQTVDVPAMQGFPAQQVSLSSAASVRSLILTPQIGYFYTTGPGFSIGLDVGAQVPIAPSDTTFSTTIPANVPQELADPTINEVKGTLKKVGQQVVPTFNFRIGWLL